jgi:hypothetical protein
MSGLVPEKRLDKNQKLVTRYVKPAGADSRVFSPPVPSVGNDKSHLLGDALKALGVHSVSGGYAEGLSAYSESTLRMIVENVASSGTAIWSGEVTQLLLDPDLKERDLREYIRYAPSVEDESDVGRALNYVRGLKHNSVLGGLDDLSDLDDETTESCRTMVKVAVWAQNKEQDGNDTVGGTVYDPSADALLPFISKGKLTEIIVKYPKRGDDILGYVSERGFESADDLVHFLEAGVHTSLIEGVL